MTYFFFLHLCFYVRQGHGRKQMVHLNWIIWGDFNTGIIYKSVSKGDDRIGQFPRFNICGCHYSYADHAKRRKMLSESWDRDAFVERHGECDLWSWGMSMLWEPTRMDVGNKNSALTLLISDFFFFCKRLLLNWVNNTQSYSVKEWFYVMQTSHHLKAHSNLERSGELIWKS